jgi:phosphoribosylformylglycinamidine synthase
MLLPESDFKLITEKMGREPNLVEQGCFLNLWSEHCSYRSSKLLLKTLPTKGANVIIGPGDDAAVVKLTEELYLAIGMESHNHPSYVDPYNGAATGVGGIVRDILSMGARPIALMDPLYFGPLEVEKNRYLLEHVVSGIAGYGNCIGVPVVGGEVVFHRDYSGNPLVNVVCVGLLEKQHLVSATAQRAGDKLILLGASTGRDGLGGASFASRDLSSEPESERGSVQIGDPYTEKLLIEATLKAIEEGLVEACRDLGAAGLVGASSEMAAKGNLGITLDLDRVHLREEGMNAFEILIAESQERMVLEVKPENVEKVLAIADKYDLKASVIGEFTKETRYTVLHRGEVVADIPVHLLSGGAPVCELPSSTPPETTAQLPAEPQDLKEAILNVLSSPNLASKQWVYTQYDHEVQLRTVRKPGCDCAVLRITEEVGIALSCGCNPLHAKQHPYLGAWGAVIENAMNLATVGATPLCIVNCLNFGNPEKPENYYQFKQAILGLGDAARAINTPVVGGNVSLYNDSEEHHTTIPPTPSIAIIGKTTLRHLPEHTVQKSGETIVLIGETRAELGGSEYYHLLNAAAGTPPGMPENICQRLEIINRTIHTGHITTAHDVSNGGLAAALAELVTPTHGVKVNLTNTKLTDTETLFSETHGRMLLTTSKLEEIQPLLENTPHTIIGTTTSTPELSIKTRSQRITLSYKEILQARETLRRTMMDY